jgi:hypothetical protein
MNRPFPIDRRNPSPAAFPQQPTPGNAPFRRSDSNRPFDYDVGYGHRSAFSGGGRYADFPSRQMFHCG